MPSWTKIEYLGSTDRERVEIVAKSDIQVCSVPAALEGWIPVRAEWVEEMSGAACLGLLRVWIGANPYDRRLPGRGHHPESRVDARRARGGDTTGVVDGLQTHRGLTDEDVVAIRAAIGRALSHR